MPTGYTAAIKDGITFQQFAMDCSRAFGAMIMMRDLPSSAPIPESFEPSDYHLNALTTARNALADLEMLTPEQASKLAADAYDTAEQRRVERLQESISQIAAYHDMLDRTRAWLPPTTDHEELKNFMVSQIEQSIKFDDNTDYYSKPTVRLTGRDWLEERKAAATKDIARHKKEYAEEVARTQSRNTWLRLLRESLAVQP